MLLQRKKKAADHLQMHFSFEMVDIDDNGDS